MRSYEPELKRQSAEWHTPSSLRPAKYRRTQSKFKMLMILPTIDMEFSLVTRSRVVKPLMGNTMRSIFKKKKTLRQAIRRKRPELLAAGPIILYDNATPHGRNGVTSSRRHLKTLFSFFPRKEALIIHTLYVKREFCRKLLKGVRDFEGLLFYCCCRRWWL